MAACNQVLRMGYGVSIDISRAGILFSPDAELEPGTRVELSLNWPATHNGEPLRLLIYGRVLRSDKRGTVAAIERKDLVPESAGKTNGAAADWERTLARFRGKLLKLRTPWNQAFAPSGNKNS